MVPVDEVVNEPWMPEPGQGGTVVERLLVYTGRFDVGLSKRIVGADDTSIDSYRRLAEFDELPAAYRAYLSAMGNDDGGLLRNFRIRAALPSVIRFYEDNLRSEPEALDANYPVVGTFLVGEQVSLDRSSTSVELPLVETSDGEFVRGKSGSWENFLMKAAVLEVESRRLPHGRWFSSSIDSARSAMATGADCSGSIARRVAALADELGLVSAWPSDAQDSVALGADRSIYAELGPQNEVMLYAFAEDERVLDRVTAFAEAALGARGGRLKRVDGVLRDAGA